MFTRIKTVLATLLISLNRGKYWLSSINFFLILFVAVSNFKQYESLKFLGNLYVLAVLFAVALVTLIVVGYIDLKKGIYRKEAIVSAHLDPITSKILTELYEIQKDIKELKNRKK